MYVRVGRISNGTKTGACPERIAMADLDGWIRNRTDSYGCRHVSLFVGFNSIRFQTGLNPFNSIQLNTVPCNPMSVRFQVISEDDVVLSRVQAWPMDLPGEIPDHAKVVTTSRSARQRFAPKSVMGTTPNALRNPHDHESGPKGTCGRPSGLQPSDLDMVMTQPPAYLRS